MAKSIINLVSSLIILLAVSIVCYAFVFNISLLINCEKSGTDLTEISMNRQEENVLEIDITLKSESFGSEFSTTSTTSTSTTTTTTTTTTTSTTETAYNCWWCGTASSSTESNTFSYENALKALSKALSDSSSDSTTEDSFWGSDSSYKSATETDDTDEWGFK